ncbi:MAG: site-specific integrase [Bacteroidales bacterium]|nr:site-specific integrase [Bacteroidales bacterium]
MASKVTLRQKPISRRRKSLYLDIYPPILNPETGKLSRRSFLGKYIYEKPTSQKEKEHNRETLIFAENARLAKQYTLDRYDLYNEYEKEQLRVKELGQESFIEYFRKLVDKRTGSNHDNWASALHFLEQFAERDIKFADLNVQFLEDFKDYLLNAKSRRSKKTNLAQNTAASYFNKIKASLKHAYKNGILQTDLNARVSSIKEVETRREHLTLEELNKLVKTPFSNDKLKRAALFSALTGLRFSDIKKMTWKELEFIPGQGYFLNFSQKKTKNIETLPISDQTVSLLGEPGNPEDNIFEELEYSDYQNRLFYRWIKEAGISKKITFHCFRHTYATLQLFNHTDIYTVSKMLGHKNLKTTLIYAKIVDEAKREAANKIQLDI